MAKNATTAPRRLVNISQAAEYADVHPVTLRRWIAAGLIPAYRVGPRLLKVDINELDAYLKPIATAAVGNG
ncbi:MAG: helix-turn-helix domain-containing protein [Marmoricola sp.]